MIKLPEKFEKRMKSLLKDEYPLYEKAINEPTQKGFRVNTDKISVSDFEKINPFGGEKIPYVENGFYLEQQKVGNHPFHHAGLIYIQEPAAMAPAECVEINPDWKILDMCAAPGGKSTQLKNKLGEKGVLVSNEIIPSRCKILTGNIERLGLKNCITTCMDTSRLAETFPNMFDFIMLDAPCSGEGMFRKEPNAILEWSEENITLCAKRQREILENAVKLLKSGGIIIYSTCTFSLEENEMVVDDFLNTHPEFTLCEVNEAVKQATVDGVCFEGCRNQNIHFTRRFYPHTNRGEGQFMAVLKSTLPKIENVSPEPKAEKINPLITDFLKDTLTEFSLDAIRIYNKNPVYFENAIPLADGKAFMYGVTIGEIKKNFISPHHQFFMAFGHKFKRNLELSLSDPRLAKYLHGEEIEAELPNGWAVVTVEGCTLGGIKVVNGTAKNHYPKGLRIV